MKTAMCEECGQRVSNGAQLVGPHDVSGRKDDQDKPRTDLLPPGPLLAIAEILKFGADKYGDHNWRGGFDWSRPYAAALRHLLAWWNGEDKDPESGKSHLAHAACNLVFLLTFEQEGVGTDNRFTKIKETP
jgi:hypothetical protein